MTERAHRLAAKPAPQTAADTIKLLEASLVLVRLAQPYKVCTCCGRVFATREDFERLPLCGSGYQPQWDDNGDMRTDVRLCLRNCGCGSTLSVEVPTEAGACTECGEYGVHAFTCDRRPCVECDEAPCVCGPDCLDLEVLP